MNYRAHHNKLIERAKTRLLEGYSERHHVVPRCMGGGNEKTNIVALTAREHYFAHQLLVKIYPDHRGVIKAANMMSIGRGGQRINNRSYGWLRAKHSEVMKNITPWNKGKKTGSLSKEHKQKISESLKGEKHPLYNLHHTDGTKRKMSKSSKGQIAWNAGLKTGPLSKEHRQNISEEQKGRIGGFLGRKHSVESNRKNAEAHIGIKQQIVTCPNCDKQGGIRAMNRWHFDNCKVEVMYG